MGKRGGVLQTGLAVVGLWIGFASAANTEAPRHPAVPQSIGGLQSKKDEAAAPRSAPAAQTLKISRMEVCPSIVNKGPQGSDTKFKAGEITRLYCYTEIEGAKEPTYVTHTWYYNNKQIVNIKLAVEALRWRNWSNKTIPPGHKGNWKVEVTGPDGNILKSAEFILE